MSVLDRPLLVGNLSYHVGHEITMWVAKPQGFCRAEGSTRYIYKNGETFPGRLERARMAADN